MKGKMKLCDQYGHEICDSLFDGKELCKKLYDLWVSISHEGDYIQIRIFTDTEKSQLAAPRKYDRLAKKLNPDDISTVKRLPTINKSIYNTNDSLYPF